MSAAAFLAPDGASTPAERFALGMANPLRASVMYPPDRTLFAPFRRRAPGPREMAATLSQARGPIGLYAHIPFCETQCTYCDYETVPLAAHDAASVDGYVDALVRELEAIASALAPEVEVAGFDLGGGTPGVLSAGQVERVLRAVERRFHSAPGFEVSIETTPTLAASDPAKWKAIARAGVARASMGVQTTDAALLARVRRGLHSFDRVRRGMDVLRDAGFAMVNVDLMFALPGLSPEAWMEAVEGAIALSPDVVTIYDTVYKNRGIAHQAPRLGLVPTPRDYGAQYDAAFARLTAAGFSARYGSVNFSRVPGRLGTSRYLESRILAGADYAGAGLYASSLIGDSWRFGRRRFEDWRAHAERGELAAEDLYSLPREHVMAKYLLLALSYGALDADRFARRFGEPLTARFAGALTFAEAQRLLRRCADGWEMVPGSFELLPGLRALFYPGAALPHLSHAVVKMVKMGSAPN